MGAPDVRAQAAPQTVVAATATAEPTASVAALALPPPTVVEQNVPLLLADPTRWVVIDDWADPVAPNVLEVDGAQLDVAPLDQDGVPQLGRRVTVGYRVGERDDFDRQWGDASSLGPVSDFAVAGGVGRAVTDQSPGSTISMAQLWVDGVFVIMQTRDPDANVAALAGSFTEVDQATWTAARQGAADQRLLAIQAAMQNIGPIPGPLEPLPHFVLPDEWEFLFVTDKTIWTAEQRAQSAAFSAANMPPESTRTTTEEYQVWQYGFADSAEDAALRFVPDLTVVGFELEVGAETWHPINYDTISALGLNGVISPRESGVSVELGTGPRRVNVDARLDEEQVRQFLAGAEFAGDSPLDGLAVADERYQLIELEDWSQRPPSWHAAWQGPSGRATLSVWRLTVPELRIWMLGRGRHLAIPDDVWQTIAEQGVIDFGSGTTYDSATGLLLISSHNLDRADLIPIELDDWIELVAPINTDPINPR